MPGSVGEYGAAMVAVLPGFRARVWAWYRRMRYKRDPFVIGHRLED